MRRADAFFTWRMRQARRLQDCALWGLETLLCLLLLDKRERRARRRASAVAASKTGELASAHLGHGCLGLFEADAGDPFLDRPALGAKAACEALVLGEGALADDLLRRLRAQGIPAHAVAHDLEERQRLRDADVTPHRLDDLPNQARRFDLVISTGLAHFVDAGLLARLPEDAVVIDLAGLPGSVNYELANKLELKVIWAPPPLGVRRERLDAKVWRDILALVARKRDAASSLEPGGARVQRESAPLRARHSPSCAPTALAVAGRGRRARL